MEYLMTYGWAILIIAVVLGALFQLGVFNSSSFSPRAPPGACQVFRPSGPGTTTNINLMGVCTGQLPQYVAQFNGQGSYVFSNLAIRKAQIFANGLTFSAWIRTNAIGINAIVGQNDGFGCTYFCDLGLEINYVSGKASMIAHDGSVYRFATSTSTVNDGNWYNIVGTYNVANSLSIYINGANQQNTAITNLYGNPSNTLIGLQDTASGAKQYFSGQIANVQIYNTSLSANQVQALYLEGIGGAPMKLQNLVGWWPLNGNANDYSGNNNNGVPTAVTFTSQYGK